MRIRTQFVKTVMITVLPLMLGLFLATPLKAQDLGAPGDIATLDSMVSGGGDGFYTDAAAQEATGEPAGDDQGTPPAETPVGNDGEQPPAEGSGEGDQEGEGDGTGEGTGEEEGTGEPVAAKPGEQAATPPALPDGVTRMKNRAGKEGLFMEQPVFDGLQANTDLVNQVSDLFQEPATIESIQLRDRAYNGQEAMYNDFLEGTPEAATRFWNDWTQTVRDAVSSGEIANDPFVALSSVMYDHLLTASPDAYANLRLRAAQDLITEMYQAAAQTGNQHLYHSAGHVAKELGLAYKPSAEMESFFATKGDAPTNEQRLVAENTRLREQLNGNSQTAAQTAYENFRTQTSQVIAGTIMSDAIQPAFASIAESWSKVDGGDAAFKDLVLSRTFDKVLETIGKDKRFLDSIGQLDRQVRRAANPQARQALQEQIVAAYVNKTKLIVGAVKGDIAKFANEKFQETHKQVQERREKAQGQRGPKGASSPVNRGLVPGKGGTTPSGDKFFDPALEAREAAALMNQA